MSEPDVSSREANRNIPSQWIFVSTAKVKGRSIYMDAIGWKSYLLFKLWDSEAT